MRKIKFRAKRMSGEWAYGSLIKLDIGYIILVNETTESDDSLDEKNSIVFSTEDIAVVIPDTIGQFTGLLDKNGKEIYEGDILLVDEVWDGGTGNVKIYNVAGIKDGCFGYIGENTGELLPFCYNKVTEEIAGNVFDNPELLEGGKE